MESHIRSIAKAISWRTGGTIVTIFVVLIITGKVELATKVGLLDTAIKIGAFYFHERLWNYFKFGKTKPPEYQI